MTLSPETAPKTFFERLDMKPKLGISTADQLWDWALSVEAGAGGAALLPVGDDVVYRGQPHADFGLTSSLYRLCRTALPAGVKEKRLAEVEAKVLTAMSKQGLGRRMSDGQLLSVLQHHGVPTRLIDFSRGPLEALYFAVESRDSTDGRLFIVRAHGRTTSVATTMTLASTAGAALPWADYARGDERAVDRWTQTVALVDPEDLDPRMIAQRGVFLVGGLNRRSAGRSMLYRNDPGRRRADTELAPELYADVTSLGVNFTTTVHAPHQSWPASGWTIQIPSSWKSSIRSRLADLDDPISRDTMYPPVDEVARLANYAVLEDLARGSRL